MTDKQRLELRQSEIRARMAELAAADATEETRSEIGTLSAEYQSNESRINAAIIAGDAPEPVITPTGDAATSELMRIINGASVGEIYKAVLEQRSTDGATRELQAHFGLAPNQVPLELLYSDQLETRAAATIAGDVEADQSGILPVVFPASVSAYLGIAQPTVPVGQQVYPVMVTGATAHTPAPGAAADESTGAFQTYSLEGRRVQASFRYRREDAAKFPGLDAALRQNLSDALMDKLDNLNVNDEDNGLLGTNGLADPTNPTGDADFADYVNLVYGSVDGIYAPMATDVRVLMPIAAYRHAGATYRNASVDRTALDRMREIAGGVRASTHIADAATDGAAGTQDQTIITRKGMRGDFVNPLWQGITIIPDEITAADNGEIKLTAVLMANRRMLRAAGFGRHEVQTA